MGNFDTASNDKALMSIFESPQEASKSLVEQLKSLSPEELANIIRQL